MSSVAVPPDVSGTVEQVMSGELFAGVLFDDTDERALALEAVLGDVVDDETRLIWVGNPLRSPLTIERFLIQIAGPEVDLREERTPKELAQIISKQIGSEARLLIVVQQPETINVETIHLLVQMGWYLSGEAVQVQFLFAGSSAFVVPKLAEPSVVAFSSRSESIELADTGPRRRDVFPLITLLIALTVGVMFSMTPASPDGTEASTFGGRPTPPEAGLARPSPVPRSTRPAAAFDRNPAAACP